MRSRPIELMGAACLGAVLVYPVAIVAHSVVKAANQVSDTISDGGYFRFDNEHHLPHGYASRMNKILTHLQQAIVDYCRQHKGHLPPMQDAAQMQAALKPTAEQLNYFINPATKIPFQPNAALQGRIYHDLPEPDRTLLISDPQPPATYQEVYFVMLSGRVGHVSRADWPEMERALQPKDLVLRPDK